MKRILITGANSYIGTSFEKYMDADAYRVDTVDTVDGEWRKKSFVGYDVVFHVAGIAHQKETKQNADLYYKVNRDLAIEAAKKAKAEGVGQFVFLSSMSVYGMDTGVITKETKPAPKSHYGKSKWQAEQEIAPLSDSSFKVCILRPPMVYGKGCKGNFGKIKKLVESSPIFPYVKNQRSMIYIDNLLSFVKFSIDNSLEGVFYPQNKEYVSTVELARGISKALGKKIYFERITGAAVACLRLVHPTARKAFGTLIYKDTEDFGFSYAVVDNEQSITMSAK